MRRVGLHPDPVPLGERGTVFVLVWALLLTSSAVRAESGWLTARGRLQPEVRLEAWGGTDSVGAGFVRPDEKGALAGLSAELGYAFRNRTVELRGARVWQFTPSRFGTASATVGAAVHLVPEGVFDVGLGPHAGLNLSLGGDVFTVDLGLQTGVELFFANALPRFPQRLQLSLNLRVRSFAVGLHARAGVDIVPHQGFLGRGELSISVSWFGFGA